MYTEYEVGQIPSDALTILVRDDDDGIVDLTQWDLMGIEILGSDNEQIDTTGIELFDESARNGIIAVKWPKTHSLFTKRGEYVLRLILSNLDGTRDYTRSCVLRVREFGRVNR
jgi:hypothetical protein